MDRTGILSSKASETLRLEDGGGILSSEASKALRLEDGGDGGDGVDDSGDGLAAWTWTGGCRRCRLIAASCRTHVFDRARPHTDLHKKSVPATKSKAISKGV